MPTIVDPLVLDPADFVPNGAELDLSGAGFGVLDANFGEADVELELQRQAIGEVPTTYHPPNTATVLALGVREEGEVDLPTAAHQLAVKVGEINTPGTEHWLRRDFEVGGDFAGSLGRRVFKATLSGLSAWQRGESPDVVLTLVTGPYWYATVEQESALFKSEAGARELIFELAEVLGTSPGLIRIRVKNEGSVDWRGLILAGESRDMAQDETADTTAAMAYDCTDLTLKGGSQIVGGPAPEIRGVGAVANGAGTISPALPAETSKGDLLVMVAESGGATASAEANTALTAAGWSSPPAPYVAQKKGNTRLTVLYRIATGEDPTLTNDTGDHQIARIIAIKAGTFDVASPFNTAGVGTQALTKAVSVPGATTTRERCLVLACASGHLPDATSTTEFGAPTNAGLTELTERVDNATNAGDGGAIYVASGVKAAKGAYGATTCTAVTEAERGVISLAIAPPLVVEHPELTAGWISILNSEVAGTGHMTHVGVRRPYFRVEAVEGEPDDVQLWLRWRPLGAVKWSENRIVPLNIVGDFQIYDLGEARPEPAVLGDQRWEWDLQARAVSGSGKVRLHRLWPLPAEQFAVVKAPGTSQVAEGQSLKLPGMAVTTEEEFGGEIPWVNPNNAKATDGSYATATLGTNEANEAQWLKLTNFGFALPEGAQVVELIIAIKRKASVSNMVFDAVGVVITNAGGKLNSSAELDPHTGIPWSTSVETAVYTFIPYFPISSTTVNAANFGVAVKAIMTGACTAYIGPVEIRIYYAEAADENRVCFADRSIELRSDGIFRQHPDDDVWGEIIPEGFLPHVIPAGMEGRKSRFIMIPSTGDLGELNDSGSNALSAQALVQPGYLFSREAA